MSNTQQGTAHTNFISWYQSHSVSSRSDITTLEAVFMAGVDSVLNTKGKNLTEQFALAILRGDDAALFAAVDKLIEDKVLPEGLKVDITIKDIPRPRDKYQADRGVVIVDSVFANSAPKSSQLHVHYRFEGEEYAHYAMLLSRFLGWVTAKL